MAEVKSPPKPRAKSRNAPAGPSPFQLVEAPPLAREKFGDLQVTADGSERATVAFERLDTLWFNTGTLCNLACANCYIESSPTNDALVFLSAGNAAIYLDEIATTGRDCREIGFTGGEPFMNPDFLTMLRDVFARGFEALVLTNAMKPMRRYEDALLALNAEFSGRLTMRVSVDHYTKAVHEAERGPNSWGPMVDGLRWLSANGFAVDVAGRSLAGESEVDARAGYSALFEAEDIACPADNPARLILFPEMDERVDVPEITEACWGILGQSPSDIMCATSRMVVHRKGEDAPCVAACTLLPYASDFDLGKTLADADRPVSLNHPHCARFCVLGGASCSA